MEPQDVLREEVQTFEKKNDDYSDTWIITGNALSMLHDRPVSLNTEVDHIINGNVHRLLDKVLRGYHGAIVKDDMNYESTYDSFTDAAVYCSMIASVLANEPTTRIDDSFTRARKGNSENNDNTTDQNQCSFCESEGTKIRWETDECTNHYCCPTCFDQHRDSLRLTERYSNEEMLIPDDVSIAPSGEQ